MNSSKSNFRASYFEGGINKDTTLIMHLLRDNINVWTYDIIEERVFDATEDSCKHDGSGRTSGQIDIVEHMFFPVSIFDEINSFMTIPNELAHHEIKP
uniref:Uncharacterized protein n=1 Tax=Lactuca sativa TaxID=4236 RepID=A0A9R1UMH0_LACSA|nr:hypothetical protein LSAT_V11C800438130 [Lactuca sativa]